MVIEHVYGLPDVIRKRILSIIDDRIGTNTYTLYSISETRNSMGRIKTRTNSTSTIKGFLHKITPQDKQLIALGIVNVGDGLFFAEHDVSISEHDEISETGETDRWTFTKLMNNDKVQGSKVYQEWVITKRV